MNQDLLQELLKGNHRALLERMEKDPSLLEDSGNLPLAVGSAVFLGDIEKAESLAGREGLPFEVEVACRFFLGLGWTRRSEYRKARSLFALNARLTRHTKCPLTRFYAVQGLAFYRFFCGRYLPARAHANRAYTAALQAKFVYGEILSRDLLGHASVNIGEVRLGIKHLEGALELAEKVGNGGISGAIRVSLLRVKSQFGLIAKTCLNEIGAALDSLPPEDTYSRGELELELARQLMLRGEIERARQILDRSCEFIYKNQNRRQAATLNLRYAYLMHLEGQHQQALHLIRVAEASVNLEVDRLHVMQMRGLRAEIERYLGRTTVIDKASETEASARLGHAIHSRILARELGTASAARASEDPLGDLIDRISAKDPSALPELIELEYFGLLRRYFDLPLGMKALIFDLVPGSLTILGPGSVKYHEKQVNGLIRRLIAALSRRPMTKEDLVKEVWRYEYDPARHDSIVHAGMTKLRKLLGPFGSWIQLGEDGYRLGSEVQVILHGSKRSSASRSLPGPSETKALDFEARLGDLSKSELVTVVSATRETKSDSATTSFKDSMKFVDLGLNFRQIQILERMTSSRSLSVSECAEHFRTSKITACRDLAFLANEGHCMRIGKGRATRYLPKPSLSL